MTTSSQLQIVLTLNFKVATTLCRNRGDWLSCDERRGKLFTLCFGNMNASSLSAWLTTIDEIQGIEWAHRLKLNVINVPAKWAQTVSSKLKTLYLSGCLVMCIRYEVKQVASQEARLPICILNAARFEFAHPAQSIQEYALSTWPECILNT